MAELTNRIDLITLRRDRVDPEHWECIVHGQTIGELSRTYNSLANALNSIASYMHTEVKTGTNWLKV